MAENGLFWRHTFSLCLARCGVRDFFLQVNPYIAIVVLTLILAIAMVWLERQYVQFSIDTLLGIIAHSCLSLGVVTVGLLRNVRVDFNELFIWGFARN